MVPGLISSSGKFFGVGNTFTRIETAKDGDVPESYTPYGAHGPVQAESFLMHDLSRETQPFYHGDTKLLVDPSIQRDFILWTM